MTRSVARGFGLVEVMLILGVVSVGMAAVYGVYSLTRGQHEQQVAAQWVEAAAQRTVEAFAADSNYRDLTQPRAMEEGLWGPNAAIEEGRVIGPWGGEARMGAADAWIGGQTLPNAAFVFVLTDVPSAVCTPLVAALARPGRTLTLNRQPLPLPLDLARSVALCNQAPTAELMLTQVRLDAHDGLRLCEAPTQPQERTVACAAGTAGEQTQRRNAHCPGRYGEPVWDPWAVVHDGCQPCPSGETRQVKCDVGFYGDRQQRRTFDCQANAWGGWQTVTETCQACPEPEERTAACPDGRTGQVVERRTFFCSTGAWGPWAVTQSMCL